MKKRVLAVVLAAVLLLTGVALAADESLVSLGYLTGSFQSTILADAAALLQAVFQPVYDTFVAGLTTQAVESHANTWQSSPTYTSGSSKQAELITLSSGSGILWDNGSCSVDSGVMVDITSGNEVLAGSGLTIGHRYVADGQTVLKVTSASATWMVEGVWHTVTNNPVAASRFTDVNETDWFYDAVNVVAERHIFNGVSETEFGPNQTTTRGMMATVLWNMEGQPQVAYEPVFSDVPGDKWYSTAVVWANQKGLIFGTGDGKCEPEKVITRQEMIVMIQHYAQYCGYIAAPSGSLDAFIDGDTTSDWARESMQWAAGEGILSGSDGRLMPQDSCTRAQIAAIIRNYLNWSDLRS